jgi:hypothetical protein
LAYDFGFDLFFGYAAFRAVMVCLTEAALMNFFAEAKTRRTVRERHSFKKLE